MPENLSACRAHGCRPRNIYFLRRTWRRRKGWDFLSPRPLRGATVRHAHRPRDDAISIHAPLAGCDAEGRGHDDGAAISIHAPLAGRDPAERQRRVRDDISIHAPLAGRDGVRMGAAIRGTNFNPRAPCGVRLDCSSGYVFRTIFQSTHPLRGATLNLLFENNTLENFNPRTPCGVRPHPARELVALGLISIHAPLAGCDNRARRGVANV